MLRVLLQLPVLDSFRACAGKPYLNDRNVARDMLESIAQHQGAFGKLAVGSLDEIARFLFHVGEGKGEGRCAAGAAFGEF